MLRVVTVIAHVRGGAAVEWDWLGELEEIWDVCHFVHQKSQMKSSGIEAWSLP
jgi:hypothetical protein